MTGESGNDTPLCHPRENGDPDSKLLDFSFLIVILDLHFNYWPNRLKLNFKKNNIGRLTSKCERIDFFCYLHLPLSRHPRLRAGIQDLGKKIDSRFRGNDRKGEEMTRG